MSNLQSAAEMAAAFAGAIRILPKAQCDWWQDMYYKLKYASEGMSNDEIMDIMDKMSGGIFNGL